MPASSSGDRLNEIAKIPYPDRRIEEYRKLIAGRADDAKLWFNLAVDLEASARVLEMAADRLRREAREAALRCVEISPTMRELIPEPIRPSPGQVKPVAEKVVEARPQDEVEARVGKTLRGYRVDGLIARSDIQALYEAVTVDGERPVWLRTVLDLPGETTLGQFWKDLGNAPAAQGLGCVKVLDVINDNTGTPFQVLSRPKGTPLSELYISATLPILEALEALVRTARALDRLHQARLFHGELRPDHVVFHAGTPGEVTLLGGGGIDLLVEAQKANPLSDDRLRWLAPETIVGWPIDARSDVYGLGLLLFFVATGRPPPRQQGQGAPAVSLSQLQAMRGEEVKVQAKLIARIDQVLSRCLLPIPLQRYGTAGEVADALSDVSHGIRVDIVD